MIPPQSPDCLRFALAKEPPVWEGLVIPGIVRADSRIQLYVAEPHSLLKPYIQSIWFMNWSMEPSVELQSIVVPTPPSMGGFQGVNEILRKEVTENDFRQMLDQRETMTIGTHNGSTYKIGFKNSRYVQIITELNGKETIVQSDDLHVRTRQMSPNQNELVFSCLRMFPG